MDNKGIKEKIKLLEDPKAVKAIGAMLAMAVISILLLRSAQALWVKNKALEIQLNKKKQELSQGASQLLTPQALDSEISRLSARLFSLEEKFFFQPEGMLMDLNRFAEAAKISLTSIEPLEKTKPSTIPGGLSEMPVNIKTKCDYYQLLAFLNKIETAPRFIIIADIKIEDNAQDIWNHDTELFLKIPLLLSAGGKE